MPMMKYYRGFKNNVGIGIGYIILYFKREIYICNQMHQYITNSNMVQLKLISGRMQWSTRAYFNSTMVQLKQSWKFPATSSASAFQFQYGSIKTVKQ